MDYSKLPDLRAASAPDAPCIADTETSLSNAVFLEHVRRAAGGFSGHGIGQGDVVALMLPNGVEFVVAMFAAWRLGAAITPINPAASKTEATHQLLDSRAKLLVNLDGEAVVTAIPALPVGALQNSVDAKTPPVVNPDQLALLIYTSGTTGKPKGVMLDHTNISAMTDMGQKSLHVEPADHCLLVLPLFHVNGIVVSILTPLSQGGRVTIRRRFDIETFFSDIEQVRPTFLSAVPTIYAVLYALPAEIKPDTSSLRYGICGAAPASAELLTGFEARYGFPILEAYGLSEGTCGSTINPIDGVRKPGTVGLPFVGQTIAVADPQGHHLAPGETGEVLIKGANVMRGYLGKPEETGKVLVDGWLHTGDLGRIDADGYLSIVGRLKEMIIRGGENIYPKEIEDTLYEFGEVLEAAVVGAPNAKLGEIVIAHVALRPGSTATVPDLEAHCADELTRHKRPAVIIIHDKLPKNAVGKIDKITLRSFSLELAK
jgi:acyl-CoA synthetase (AMP-forming)/AMP-acid ligase II